MAKEKRSDRTTIGVLIDRLIGGYQVGIWHGALDSARERDINLFIFPGGVVGLDISDSVVYDMVDAERLDGLLIASSLIHKSAEEATAFCGRHHPLPMVSLGVAVEGIPSVTVENYAGMQDAVAHLITVHDRRRIAFICGSEGNAEAEERYRAYVDVLAEHDIPLDPDLVAPGAFTAETGEAAISLLLDQRKVDFDAVVAANDYMAIGALNALHPRGLRVPADVAIVGFDDVQESGCTVPPLTTVRQLVDEMGHLGIEMLLAQITGAEVSEQTILPTQLVSRRSCGCQLEAVIQAAAEAHPAGAPPFRRDDILAEMAQLVPTTKRIPPEQAYGWVTRLLDGFIAEVKAHPADRPMDEPSDAFLPALDTILRQAIASGGDASIGPGESVAAWQNVISTLRHHMLPSLKGKRRSRAETLWQQARVMIGEATEQVQGYQTFLSEQEARTLREVSASLITTFDIEKSLGVLTESLPRLHIPSAFLSLYEDPDHPTDHARLMLAYNEEGRIELDPEGQRYPSRQLVPQELLPQEKPLSFVVEPLYFLEDQLGIALFEIGSRDGSVYDGLQGEISSSLQGAFTLQAREEAEAALEQAYAEVELQVQERTAELQREVAEREKTQEENLRLQQEVIDAQKRAIQELSTPIIPVLEGIIVMPLIGSVDSMRARELTRTLLSGIRDHRARVVILDITGVPIVDSGVASHLNKTIQAARLKGARTIVTGISDAVAETIIDQGIDWSAFDTLADLQTGLRAALAGLRRQHHGGPRQ